MALSPELRAEIEAAAERAAAKFPPLTRDQLERAATIVRAERGAIAAARRNESRGRRRGRASAA